MTTLLVILAVWLTGWAAGTRIALTYRMTRTMCTGNHGKSGVLLTEEYCRNNHPTTCRASIGETRDRTIRDGMWAAWVALAWPLLIVARIIIGTTPRTPGETQRIIDQQAATIKRLTAALEPAPGGTARRGLNFSVGDLENHAAYNDLYGDHR